MWGTIVNFCIWIIGKFFKNKQDNDDAKKAFIDFVRVYGQVYGRISVEVKESYEQQKENLKNA